MRAMMNGEGILWMETGREAEVGGDRVCSKMCQPKRVQL
jgi:hypothetical protein